MLREVSERVGVAKRDGVIDIGLLEYVLREHLNRNQAYVDSTVDADTLNLHPQMANITIPTLLMWGREDLVVPLEVGEASYAALGTPDDDKTLLVFDDTAHTVPNEAPQESLDAMEAFIDAVLAGEPSSPSP